MKQIDLKSMNVGKYSDVRDIETKLFFQNDGEWHNIADHVEITFCPQKPSDNQIFFHLRPQRLDEYYPFLDLGWINRKNYSNPIMPMKFLLRIRGKEKQFEGHIVKFEHDTNGDKTMVTIQVISDNNKETEL